MRNIFLSRILLQKSEGVGLGLTIAGEIVDEYKGTLELLKEGSLKGACFRISFLKAEGSLINEMAYFVS